MVNEEHMGKTRLEAFSDGVIAIIITIMVLEFKTPHDPSLSALAPLIPVLLSYLFSFIVVAIYWNNHHHSLHLVEHVDGRIMWANAHFLFWLSLVPFATDWMGETHFSAMPVAVYGVVLLGVGFAYSLLIRSLIKHHSKNSAIAKAIGKDYKGKISLALYIIAIAAAFSHEWISLGIYILVALIWFIPDRRIEKKHTH